MRLPPCMLVAVCVLGVGVCPARTPASDRSTLKNNLLPGHFTRHRITRTIHRRTQREKKEHLTYQQAADWVQLNVHEPRPGGVRVFQMIVDHPATVVSLKEGGKAVTPRPSPAYFGLSQGGTRLHSLERGPQEATVLLPKGGGVDTAVLGLLLDFAHWPKHAVDPGDKWERDVRTSMFAGTQQFEFINVIEARDETAIELTMYVTGDFGGALEKDYRFKKGQAIIHWARMDRSLLKLEARAEYERMRPEGVEQYEMKLDVRLVSMKTHNADQLEDIVDQLIAFDQADTALRKGKRAEARTHCEAFRRKWPTSMWMPALETLEQQLAPRKSARRSMSSAQLARALGEALIKWEAARQTRDYDVVDQTRRLLRRLNREHGAKIRALAREGDEKRRGPAVFALAFSARDDDFFTVQKYARDPVAAVRAMALAGIAARRDPETSGELLLLALADEKAVVRARACEAVAACISREHFSIAKMTEVLGTLLIRDESRGVRLQAARALTAIGGPPDVERFEKALSRETDDEIRREINKGIETLRNRDE